MKETYEKIPQEIKENGLFCVWQWEEHNGRHTKVPYSPVSGLRARSNDSESFTTFRKAASFADRDKYFGIGIGIFHGIGAIDLDHCVSEDGAFVPMARAVIELMHSYTEYSPSGDGVHILFRVDEDFKYNSEKYYIMNHKSGMEVYIAGATNKYVTVTGNEINQHYEFGDRTEELRFLLEQYMKREKSEKQKPAVNAINAGNPQMNKYELLHRARRSKNGVEFSELWNGNWEGRYQSHSEADLALCCYLAFWTGRDSNRMDQLFRQSGLMRSKWNRRQSGTTYGAITIEKAMCMTTEVYTPRPLHEANNSSRSSEKASDNYTEDRRNIVTEAPEKKTEFAPVKPLSPEQNQLPEFPVECLPEALKNYVSAVAEHSQTSPDMAASIGLGVLAACLQGKYLVENSSGYREPLSLFILIVALPGERKSSVMSCMTKHLVEYEKDFNSEHAEEIRDNKMAREALEIKSAGLKKKLERKYSKDIENELHKCEEELDALPELKPARFFADDSSSEALTSLMKDNNGVISVISTEGGIFDIMTGRYSEKVNIDVWLKGHDGDSIRVDRLGREAEYIQNPALSAILTVQPRVLEEIMSNKTLEGRGLIARFFYSSPISRIGSRVYLTPKIPSEVREAYKNMIYQLMSRKQGLQPLILTLKDEAACRMGEYFQEHETYLLEEGQMILDWASKYIGAVLRIAGLIHLGNLKNENLEITLEEMENAIKIGKYFLAHASYAYSMMGTDESIRKARFVWARLKKNGETELKRSKLYQMCRGKNFKKTEDIFPTLELLVEYGYIRVEEPEMTGKAGRPADAKIFVNPEAMMQSVTR